ncbi:hypothetical protein SO694_00072188 [Aureococcus anophagefferens]|uniref:Uncharacterized protein n=1 Tax=Aureococcus anophagefferens TaxID=44056 RepID=A0ABR1FIK1_AURAN
MHACDRDELLEQARQELDDVQAPLLAQMARASGPEFPWLLAASGRDDDAVRHAEQCCARAGLLRAPADRLGAALGAAWLVSAPAARRGRRVPARAARGDAGAPGALGPQHAFVGALMAEGAAAKFDASAVGERDATTRPLLNVARNVWDARQGNRSRATDDGAGAAWWPFRTPPPGRGVDADDRVLGEGGDGKPGPSRRPRQRSAAADAPGRRLAGALPLALAGPALLERIARGRELRAAYDAAIASTCAETRVVYVGVGSGLELAACCAAAAPPVVVATPAPRRTSWPPASPGASRGEASAAAVVFELDDLALASGRGRATLTFAGDFDAARDYAVVCWPEAGFESFSGAELRRRRPFPHAVLKARNAARVRELLHAAGTPSPRMLPTADAIFALARDPDLERVAFEDAAALAGALVRAGAAWPAFPKGGLAPGAGNDANPCACF